MTNSTLRTFLVALVAAGLAALAVHIDVPFVEPTLFGYVVEVAAVLVAAFVFYAILHR